MKFSTIAPIAAAALMATGSTAQVSQVGYTCKPASYLPNGAFSHYGCGVGIEDAKFGVPFTASWCDTFEGVRDLCNPNQQQQMGFEMGFQNPNTAAVNPSRRTAASFDSVGTGQDQFIVPGPGFTVDDVKLALAQLSGQYGNVPTTANPNVVSRRTGTPGTFGSADQDQLIVPGPGFTVDDVKLALAELGANVEPARRQRRNLLQANGPDAMTADFLTIVSQLQALGLINLPPTTRTVIAPAPQTNVVSRRTASSAPSASTTTAVPTLPALAAPGSPADMAAALNDLQRAGISV